MELWLAGEHVRARAVAVEGADRPDEAAAGLTAYRQRCRRRRAPWGWRGTLRRTSWRGQPPG